MQSLRVVASGHQLALDFERAKSEMAAWARDTLWNVSTGTPAGHKSVTDLNIYHWLKHRGSFTFTDEAISQALLAACEKLCEIETAIDDQLKRATSDSDSRARVLKDLIQSVMRVSDHVREKLDEAIQVVIEAEQRKDALTKALSRRYMPAVLQREIVFAKRSRIPFCILMIDIDDFKSLNDQYGHRVGDVVLEGVAHIVIERVRPGDYIFRYGGDEFLVVISETTLDVAAHIAEDIRRATTSRRMPTKSTSQSASAPQNMISTLISCAPWSVPTNATTRPNVPARTASSLPADPAAAATTRYALMCVAHRCGEGVRYQQIDVAPGEGAQE